MGNNKSLEILSKVGVYGKKVFYKDKYDLIRKSLIIYTSICNFSVNKKGETFLRPRLVDVLSFYILYDYSDKTKNIITEALGIKSTNLNQINSELTDKGFLVRDSKNFRKKHLSKELYEFKRYFMGDTKGKIFLTTFTPLKQKK